MTDQPTPKPARGGSRRGAGVKTADGTDVHRVNLTLDDATLAAFAALGGGKVSTGAREAVRLLARLGALPPPPPGV